MGASAAIETVLETNGARLAVRQVGVGHPIVALHGGPDFDYEYLLPEIDRLADLGQLVLYAQRGRGRSYAGEGPADVTIESEMADLDAVRASTGSQAVAVIGHSWGTVLAMESTRRSRVSSLGNGRGPSAARRQRAVTFSPASVNFSRHSGAGNGFAK